MECQLDTDSVETSLSALKVHEQEGIGVSCGPCVKVEGKYTAYTPAPHFFILHMSDFRRKSPHRAIRKKALDKLLKIVCALRNTSGGDILIHLCEQNPDDRYLGHFDEFMSAIFPTVADFGEMATDAYTRTWLSDVEGFEEYRTFIVLAVSKSPWIVTADFNTRIRSDFETSRPSHLTLLSILSKSKNNPVICKRKPPIRGLNSSHIQCLHESRNIELKSFRPQVKSEKGLENDGEKLANYIWFDLKLKDSVTSMSKLPDGGSYYVGISEKRVKYQTYESIIPVTDGLNVRVEGEELRAKLLALARSKLSVLDKYHQTGEAPTDLIDITIHNLDTNSYVVEVGVSYYDGIVFSDSCGPRSYKIENGMIVRMPFEEWVSRLRNIECPINHCLK